MVKTVPFQDLKTSCATAFSDSWLLTPVFSNLRNLRNLCMVCPLAYVLRPRAYGRRAARGSDLIKQCSQEFFIGGHGFVKVLGSGLDGLLRFAQGFLVRRQNLGQSFVEILEKNLGVPAPAVQCRFGGIGEAGDDPRPVGEPTSRPPLVAAANALVWAANDSCSWGGPDMKFMAPERRIASRFASS